MKQPVRFNSISDFHAFCGLPNPEHPLISLIDYSKVRYVVENEELKWIQNFYSIGLKKNVSPKFNYGQQQYDFDSGVLCFVSPQQYLSLEIDPDVEVEPTGYLLLIHPDFLWNTPLANTIKQYEYFGYAVNEALFVSEKEEATINQVTENIRQEYHANIDKFSKQIIISQVETLLNYAERYYNRQFITRENTNHQILDRLEKLLADYFNSDQVSTKGLPLVQDIAAALHISPKYLSTLLKVLTGQNTQQHIHDKLIEKAKERLSTTNLSVSEIAYELGFSHPQSFNKLFKTKTNQSPLEFRASFN